VIPRVGMRQERPFLCLDRRRPESISPTGDGHFALDGRLTDAGVECGIFRKGWRYFGPGNLEPLGGLHRIPFALGNLL